MVSSRFISIMDNTGDKLTKSNSQQSDLYNYNLDHVYCSDNSRYRNAGTHLNITSAASDLKSLRRENKQLQAMLLLHLDLIQEQSNQLIAKDKQLIQLREENAQLRLKCERTPAVSATTNERRPNSNNNLKTTSTNRHSINTAATIATASTTSIVNATSLSHKVLNTSAGSPAIETYFTTSSNDPKISTIRAHQQHENINSKFKTINNTNAISNVLFNNNNSSCSSSSGNNDAAGGQIIVNENKSQTIYPTIKVEMPSDGETTVKKHTQVLNTIGPIVKDRYKVVTSSLNKCSGGIGTIGTVMRHDKTVKYRAIENNVIGHNNGKIISKIILQRKRSENGEKIFVRTKNIEIGSSNNRVNYGKWSPLRTIKSEVIDNDTTMIEKDLESKPELLQNDTATAPPTPEATATIVLGENLAESSNSSCTAAINDEEASSDLPKIDEALTMTNMPSTQQQTISSASSASSPSIPHDQFVEQSDASVSECHIDNIKIEQEIDDILDESDVNNVMPFHLDVNSDDDKMDDEIQIEQPYRDEDDENDDEGDEDDENEADVDDEEEENTGSIGNVWDNQDSQDTSIQEIEAPQASDKYNSESMQCIPSSSSPVTSIVSTSDFTVYTVTSNGSGAAGGGGTILYPIAKRHINRNAFLTTRKPYNIREWLLDEIEMELKQEITDEICKEENEANLELPKWRTWEMSSNRESPVPREYEDLSDDAFVRRHARFLLDERKRKKWDVQRIREQRTIERLKRRHCKDELSQEKDMAKIFTFYPTVDQLKTIQITDDLPVSAFGEPIPLLPAGEFLLPWHLNPNASGSLDQTRSTSTNINQVLNISSNHDPNLRNENSNCSTPAFDSTPSNVSSIIFLSKRRPGRTRTSISHNNQLHPNVKCIT